ncbi:MAG TPA: hypothetical protein VN922_02470 [Bacteroidia bacterium]|nr:hypothetical protein [Bacteroidia bacterium]
MPEIVENKLKMVKVAEPIILNKHSWFISKYSKKYNSKILVFNPFRKFRKDGLGKNNIALT